MADEKTDMPWLNMTSVPGFWLDAPIKAGPVNPVDKFSFGAGNSVGRAPDCWRVVVGSTPTRRILRREDEE